MEDFLVDIEASEYEVVINDTAKVGGRLSGSVEENPDLNKDVKNMNREYIIRGALVTSYYEPDLRRIETRRYIFDDIEVEKEEFGSLNDEIIYHFIANGFRVKYQMSQTPEEYEKLMNG